MNVLGNIFADGRLSNLLFVRKELITMALEQSLRGHTHAHHSSAVCGTTTDLAASMSWMSSSTAVLLLGYG